MNYEPFTTKQVEKASAVEASTLNVWVSRGLIPGVQPGIQGKARTWTYENIEHVALMGWLVRYWGIEGRKASEIAIKLLGDGQIADGRIVMRLRSYAKRMAA